MLPAGLKLTHEDRDFFAALGRIIFMNPFSEEREALLARVAPGHAGEAGRLEPRFYAFAAEVNRRIEHLDRNGRVTLQNASERDAAVLRDAFLYQVYHRHVAEIDEVIHRQLGMRTGAAPVQFAVRLIGEIRSRGFSEAESTFYLAVFYQLRRAFHFIVDALVGDSASMQQLRRSLWNAVFTYDMRAYERCLWNRMEDFSTLLLGETGTGKGSAAAAIGRSGFIPFDLKSGRFVASFAETFIATNLSQFPETLIESELFGHRKGAFTGAIEDHAGLFGMCDAHGALFLDEIGEASVPIQIKLLQVLQDRTYTPLGSHATKRFSGRVIAATNRPLAALRDEAGLRDDFFYRLCSDVIVVPTLRARIAESPAEMAQLVALLVSRSTGEESGELAAQVLAALQRDLPPAYPWPGNVRELEQAVRRVLLTGTYGGAMREHEHDAADTLARSVRDGALDAAQLLARYCALLHQRFGTYEEVARRTGLDRRTVRKYVLEGRQRSLANSPAGH